MVDNLQANISPFTAMRMTSNAMKGVTGVGMNALSSSMASSDAVAGRETVPFATMYHFNGESKGVNTTDFRQIHYLDHAGAPVAASVDTYLAIAGNGMFVVNDANGDTGYTRVGTFDLDGSNILKNHLGQTLQVVMRDPNDTSVNGVISATAGTTVDADFSSLNQAPNATSSMAFSQVMPGNTALNNTFGQTNRIYDTLGNAQTLNMTWEKVPNLTAAAADVHHTWKLTSALDATKGSIPQFKDDLSRNPYNAANNGVFIEFDATGAPLRYKVDSDGSGTYVTSATPPDMAVQWLGVGTENAVTVNLAGLVSRGKEMRITNEPVQDGYSAGAFHDLQIDEQGYGWVGFTNGQSQRQFRMPMAQINNYNGMFASSNGVYYTTNDSGSASNYYPMEQSLGYIVPKHYEGSSVDQTKQYVRMVEYEKALMMLTKAFNTSIKMLETITTRLV